MRLMLVTGVVALSMIVPAASLAQSGVDEYTVRPPSSSNNGHTSGAPTAHPQSLSPQAQQALANQPDAEELTTIATAPQLGAPKRPHRARTKPHEAAAAVPAGSDTPSASEAASNALGGIGWAAVLAAVTLGIGVSLFARRRVRGA